MDGRDTTMAGDLAGDITRRFDGMAVVDTAAIKPWKQAGTTNRCPRM
jgi:hypothetical protein